MRSHTARIVAIASSLWLVSGTALGHSGHGAILESTRLLHYASEPVHVVPWVLVALASVALVRRGRASTLRAEEGQE